MQLAEIFGLPFVYTGHSLGRSKFDRLLNGGMTEQDMIKKYKIDTRIALEEEILTEADLVVTNTRQEIELQYAQYENKDLPTYKVIPPGLDIDKFYPFYHDMLAESGKEEVRIYAKASMLEELNRFFLHPDRSLILSLCRPDKRKNIAGLIKAYGEDLELQSMANLAVFAGIRKNIPEMEDNERDVLTEILLLMDKYDLYGKIAIPKRHDFEYEVPELYRIAAERRGVFVNSAMTEPFGITLIESAACGLPFIAPDDGGPRDIVENCRCGVLVDTADTKKIAASIKEIITDMEKWKRYSKAGIMNTPKVYTWVSHAETYIQELKKRTESFGAEKMRVAEPSDAVGRRLMKLHYILVTDIDDTLIGEQNGDLDALLELLHKHREVIGFAVATGRTVDSAVEFLNEHSVPQPDIVVSSVGTEIYYGPRLQYGRGWDTHISSKWNREKIVGLLEDFPFLQYQEEANQRRFKISYNMKPKKDRITKIHDRLLRNKCRYNLIYSHGNFVDILPNRASKGKAIRYLSYKWQIPLKNFLVCGDSGNDEEMLRGEPLAVVVSNHHPELDRLKGARNVYFANRPYAGGILEGIEKYKLLERMQRKAT